MKKGCDRVHTFTRKPSERPLHFNCLTMWKKLFQGKTLLNVVWMRQQVASAFEIDLNVQTHAHSCNFSYSAPPNDSPQAAKRIEEISALAQHSPERVRVNYVPRSFTVDYARERSCACDRRPTNCPVRLLAPESDPRIGVRS